MNNRQPRVRMPNGPYPIIYNMQDGEFLLVRITDHDFSVDLYSTRDTLMGNILSVYNKWTNYAMHGMQIRMFYKGDRIFEDSTPRSLGMNNGDVIEVFISATAGG